MGKCVQAGLKQVLTLEGKQTSGGALPGIL